jgi:hypothetical protein
MSKLNYKVFIGKVYNLLKIISIFFKNNYAWAKCSCKCGSKCEISLSSVIHNRVKSCGCLRKETARKLGKYFGSLKVIHGEAINKTITPEYRISLNMISRCYNKNCINYAAYGGRRISIFKPWLSKKNGAKRFIKWLLSKDGIGRRPSPKYSIDRIDNDGNYEPGNLKWSTKKEQQNNRRKYKLKV